MKLDINVTLLTLTSLFFFPPRGFFVNFLSLSFPVSVNRSWKHLTKSKHLGIIINVSRPQYKTTVLSTPLRKQCYLSVGSASIISILRHIATGEVF